LYLQYYRIVKCICLIVTSLMTSSLKNGWMYRSSTCFIEFYTKHSGIAFQIITQYEFGQHEVSRRQHN